MANYNRKQIHMVASNEKYYNKSKKMFGSCVIEEKDGNTNIKVKAYGLTMGEPHTVNFIFYSEKERLYNYITLGFLDIQKGEGEFKEEYTNKRIEGFNFEEAQGVFIEVKGDKGFNGVVLLTGIIDESFSFKNELVEYKKKRKENFIAKEDKKDVVSEKVASEKDVITEQSRAISNKSLWLEKETIDDFQKKDSYGETHYSNVSQKKEGEKSNRGEKGKFSHFYNEIHNSDENTKDYSMDILGKLKDEVETIAKIASKNENDINTKDVRSNEKEEKAKKTIEYIFANNERVDPFEIQNIDVSWRKIDIKDIGVLQKTNWNLFYEPLIVNAYDRHGEILLGEYFNEERDKKHLLAIKDIYRKSNMKSAVNAGVLQFKAKRADDEVIEDCLGYWIISL